MTRLRVVTVAGDADAEADLAAALAAHSGFDLVLRCVERSELLGAVRGAHLDAVVSVGLPPWVDGQVTDECRRASVTICALGADAELDRARRLGIRLLPADVAPSALRAAIADEGPPAPPSARQPERGDGRLVAVWGPKGAPGRTTVALELAWAIAAREPKTLLVDADTYGGDVLQLSGIVEELANVIWAARMAAKDELDEARLTCELRRAGESGPAVLAGLPRAELWPEVSEFGWRRFLDVTRATFRAIVCDVGFCLEPGAAPYPEAGEGRNAVARLTVGEADRVVAVVAADPVGVKTFLWTFELLRELVDVDDVVIVANRVVAGDERELGDLMKRHVGKRPIAYIPDRPAELRRAVAAGTSLAEGRPGSDVVQAIRLLASAIGADVASGGLLARLGRKR